MNDDQSLNPEAESKLETIAATLSAKGKMEKALKKEAAAKAAIATEAVQGLRQQEMVETVMEGAAIAAIQPKEITPAEAPTPKMKTTEKEKIHVTKKSAPTQAPSATQAPSPAQGQAPEAQPDTRDNQRQVHQNRIGQNGQRAPNPRVERKPKAPQAKTAASAKRKKGLGAMAKLLLVEGSSLAPISFLFS